MSFRRLVSVIDTNATAYPPPPPSPIPRSNLSISVRRPTDETDTESSATSLSEDSDSDNDSKHLLDYNTRILRRKQAEARLRNRLRPVQNLVNGDAQHDDHFYKDVARPFFDETIFMAHVVVLTIGRLLLRLFWFVLESLWRTILLALDLIIEAIWIVCNIVWASFEFTLDLLLRVVFAIPQILRNAPWWMVKYIPGSMLSMLVILSLMRGFKGITNFVCADPGLTKEWTSLAGACNHTQIKEIIKHENLVLDELVYANDAIFQSVVQMSGIGRPDSHPGHVLMRETLALVQFTEAHNESLAAFSKRHDLVAVANAVHSNIIAFNVLVERFAHSHRIHLDELEIRMQKILRVAKEHRAQSPYTRFLLESATFVFPNTFSHTSVGHQTSHYVGVTTRFLSSPETTTILQQANNITLHMSRAAQDLVIVREAIKRYEPFWKKNCQPNGKDKISDTVDCGVVDPADLSQCLKEALQQTQAAAAKPKELRKLHNKVKNAMTHLRGNLVRLLKIAAEENITATADDDNIAAKYKTAAARKKTTAAAGKKMDVKDRLAIIVGMKTSEGVNKYALDSTSARAVLHQFVVEVGAIDLMIGTGTFVAGMGLGEGVAMGSRYERRSDGSLVPHLLKYN